MAPLEDLLELEYQLNQAKCYEDLFGDEPDAAEDQYHSMCSPLTAAELAQTSAEHQKLVEVLQAALEKHFTRAQEAVSNGTYGERKPLPTVVLRPSKDQAFTLIRMISESEVCRTYRGWAPHDEKPDENMRIIVRIANGSSPELLHRNSRLLADEAIALKKLLAEPDDPNMLYLPQMITEFYHRAPGMSQSAQVNIIRYCPGLDFVRTRLRKRWQAGVNGEHLAWIMQRVLSTLEHCCRRGIVHGNIKPSHLIIDADYHCVRMVDWQYSAKVGEAVKPAPLGAYSAPELFNPNCPAMCASDVYSLGKSVIYLAGGNPANNALPAYISNSNSRI